MRTYAQTLVTKTKVLGPHAYLDISFSPSRRHSSITNMTLTLSRTLTQHAGAQAYDQAHAVNGIRLTQRLKGSSAVCSLLMATSRLRFSKTDIAHSPTRTTL